MGSIAVPERKDASGQMVPVTVPDHIDVLATFRGGVTAHLRFSSVAGLAPAPELWMFGTAGTVRFDPGTKKLFGGIRGDKSLGEIVIPPEKRIGWRVEQEFVSAIRGNEKVSRTNFEDGVLYMEFTEAVARSLEQRRTIDLPLV
jgi:predicted dehydrogenase